jgi:hypothetical protein
MNQKTKRRKMMSKKEIEGIEKIIKEYLKKNLRIEPKVRYIDEYSSPENSLEVYLGDELIQEVSLYELDFRR